jgi:hypothetical protein
MDDEPYEGVADVSGWGTPRDDLRRRFTAWDWMALAIVAGILIALVV